MSKKQNKQRHQQMRGTIRPARLRENQSYTRPSNANYNDDKDCEGQLTSDELRKLSSEIGDDWNDVGLQLGLKQHKLNEIKLIHPDDNTKACFFMLNRWKETANKFKATRNVLDQTIKKCRANKVYVVDQLPLDELQRISVDIQNIWYKVGLELGLDQIKLNALKDDHPTKACFHMLTKWKKASKKISKSELYQAIEKCQATKDPEISLTATKSESSKTTESDSCIENVSLEQSLSTRTQNNEDLVEPPTAKKLQRICCQIAHMWKSVGVELGLETCCLDIIEADHPKSCEDACFCMLLKWKQQDINASQQVLYEAIEKCKANRKDLEDRKYREDQAIKHYKEREAVKIYTAQLKKKYCGYSESFSEQQWPPISAKFTNLGYVIHKPKRTAKETEEFARLATSGYQGFNSKSTHACDSFGLRSDQNSNNCFELNITIKEEISDIFLPMNNNGRSQIVLIEGAPGIGKTMLMIQIGTLWAKGEILDNKELVLLLPLRELNVDKINSIEDIFNQVCQGIKNAQICKEYFVNNNGQGLVILLDGLDENSQAMKKETFLYKTLIKDNVFSKACIIITSRPHATVELQKLVSYRVEIIGFTNERRRQFVRDNLKENANDLENYLEKHHTIDTLCYIPLNMSILLFLFHEKNRLKDDYPLPDTQTELLKQAITMTILHNLEKLEVCGLQGDLKSLPEPYNNFFNYLCALAYDALNKNKSIFNKRDIEVACPVKGDGRIQMAITNGLGLLQTARFFADVSGNTDTLSNFAHFSIQEFLAAWYFTFDYWCLWPLPLRCQCLRFLSQVKVLKDKFWKGDYMNMWSFYVGLTRGEDLALRQFLSGTSLPCYCMHCKKGFSISKYILNNKIKALMLYYFLQEAPDNVIIQLLDVVVTPKHLDINGQTVNIKEAKVDLELLGFILSRPYITDQWDMVILSSCEIDDESFEVLHNILTRNDKSPKIKALSLCNNVLNLCSDVIANLVCSQKIEFLNLSNNKLEGLNCFQKCAGFIETLKISNNGLNDENALKLFEILKYFDKLKVLSLNNNNISNDQKVIDTLGIALCCCNSLEELEIYGNGIEDEALILFEVINDIRSSKSNVHYYRLSNKAFAFLKILGYCDQTDHTLELNIFRNKIIESVAVNISYNGLPGDAGCLGQHLHLLVSLKILNITRNNVSDEATKTLTIGMLLTPKLEEFKCEDNLFSENSILIFKMIQKLRTTNSEILKCKPSEVKAVLFILDCIDDNAEELHLSDIVSVISNVTELNLSGSESATQDYKLTSEDIKKLCKVLTWFKNLNLLDIANNHITDEIKESLAMVMLQISTLNSVKLIGNPIFHDDFCMGVFNVIESVRAKQLESIIDNQKSSSHILSFSLIFIMDCLSKLKNPDCHQLFNNIIILDIYSESVYTSKLFEYLYFLPSLKNLTINNVTCTTDDGMKMLSEYLLTQNITLTTLDLSGCDLENLELKNGNRNNKSLKFLKCNYCKIKIELLRSFIVIFRNVAHLEIEGNNLCDEGVTILHNALCNNENDQELYLLFSLKILSIASNNISNKSTRCLAIKMILNSELEIDYSKNSFSEENVMIFKMIKRLRTINESFECKSSEVKALSFILSCINNNPVFQSVPSDIVSIISNVTRLNLSYSESATLDHKLSSEDLEELCAVLKLFKQLKVLDVSNNNIADEAKKSLVEAMLQIDTLNDLELFGNPISNSKLVFDTIKKLRENRVQSIANSQKSSSHVFYIMECLMSLKSINCRNIFVSVTTLDINSLSDHGEKFFKYLDYLPSLKNLKINNFRNTTDSDMNLLSEYPISNKALSKLDLSGCDLEKLEIEDEKINHSLEVLKCNCSKITCKLLRNLMLFFRSVVHLEMEENDLRDEGISTLHDVLLNNDRLMSGRSMTTLKLANNKITSSSSAIKIVEIVQKYKVEYLDISHNELSTFSCSEKHTVTTLEELHIANNKLELDGGFVHILQNCTKLEILHLENNRITNDAFKYLATGYLYTSKLPLETLHLENNPFMDEAKNVSVLKMIDKLHLKSDYELFKCLPAEFSVFLFILELVHSVSHKTDNVPKIIFRIESINISYSEYSSLCDQQKKITNQKLQSHDLKQFCKYLKYFKSLECINMIDNNIKDDEDVMDAFAIAVLKNSCIIEVQLDGNPIHRLKKCAILFDTIEKMRTCACRSSYVLKDHPETLKGLIYILEYIDKFDDKKCDITETIEDLDISQIESVDVKKIENPEKMSESLVRHLKLFCKLKTLNLSHGCVTSKAIQELSCFLKDNDTLLHLDLSCNHIQADGALDILKSLETSTCTTLKMLNLSNNKITGEKICRKIAIKIHNLCKDHKMDIDVKNNKLSEESKRILGIVT